MNKTLTFYFTDGEKNVTVQCEDAEFKKIENWILNDKVNLFYKVEDEDEIYYINKNYIASIYVYDS